MTAEVCLWEVIQILTAAGVPLMPSMARLVAMNPAAAERATLCNTFE